MRRKKQPPLDGARSDIGQKIEKAGYVNASGMTFADTHVFIRIDETLKPMDGIIHTDVNEKVWSRNV